MDNLCHWTRRSEIFVIKYINKHNVIQWRLTDRAGNPREHCDIYEQASMCEKFKAMSLYLFTWTWCCLELNGNILTTYLTK